MTARHAPLFEHSPWIEARADGRPWSGDRYADLMAVVRDATDAERLALIRAHPELAGKVQVTRIRHLCAEHRRCLLAAGLHAHRARGGTEPIRRARTMAPASRPSVRAVQGTTRPLPFFADAASGG